MRDVSEGQCDSQTFIESNDTVNPDQDIKPMFKYVIPMSWTK